MITMKEWMELVDYRITEGGDFYSNVDGLYHISSWNGEQDGYSFDIVFSPGTQDVFMVEANDFKNNRAYRIKHPSLVLGNVAWDDTKYIDLESDDDFIQKSLAIKAGEEYDTRVSIPIELPDDELFTLMKMAHDRDITFNQLVEQAIMELMKKHGFEE